MKPVDPLVRKLQPWLARLLSSREVRQLRRHWFSRRAQGGAVLHVFLKLSDPYSYLLAQVLSDLQRRYRVAVRCYLVRQLPAAMFPEPELWQLNAVRDCRSLAELYDLRFEAAEVFPASERVDALEAELVARAETGEDILGQLPLRLEALWAGRAGVSPGVAPAQPLQVREHMSRNEALLAQWGHYSSGMVYFGGEWYWGLDRLGHLEQRLLDEGLNRCPGMQVRYNRQDRDFCLLGHADDMSEAARDLPLEMYFSIRSPYSYLGLEKAAQLCHHYGLSLDIRPVLPMVMRGLRVPRSKTLYIFLDAKREAEKAGIPFGFVADPLGAGVECCYQLFDYAREQGRAVDYLLSVARGVYAEGVDISTRSGLRCVVERAGLDWAEARRQLGNTVWTEWAQKNLEDLYQQGFWGVPAFRYGDTRAWGQDRLWLIERAITQRSRDTAGPVGYQGVSC